MEKSPRFSLDDPLQVVALAIELEQHCSLLYQEWARRFKPYDRNVSALLQELAEEEVAHAREFHTLLKEIAEETPDSRTGTHFRPVLSGLSGSSSGTSSGSPSGVPPAFPPEFAACIKGLDSIQDHFFVTGPVMATTILEAALKIEELTRQIYEDLGATAGSEVAAVCRRLHALETSHAAALEQRLAAERQKLPVT